MSTPHGPGPSSAAQESRSGPPSAEVAEVPAGPSSPAPGPTAHRGPEPVSAALRDAKERARATHFTVGTLRSDPDGTLWLECSCGTVLRNGPTWSLDEHVRLHRAEAKYLELSAAAPPGIPRLIDPGR